MSEIKCVREPITNQETAQGSVLDQTEKIGQKQPNSLRRADIARESLRDCFIIVISCNDDDHNEDLAFSGHKTTQQQQYWL